MRVLIDTSVWIEFFKKSSKISVEQIPELLRQRSVVTCLPVKAELLSGLMKPYVRQTIQKALNALIHADLDWNSKIIWNELIELAYDAQRKKIGIPGLVDRMILLSALHSNSKVWTLDKKLKSLCVARGILF